MFLCLIFGFLGWIVAGPFGLLCGLLVAIATIAGRRQRYVPRTDLNDNTTPLHVHYERAEDRLFRAIWPKG